MPILCLVLLAPSLAEGCELVQCAQGRRERFGRRKVSCAGAHAARSGSPTFRVLSWPRTHRLPRAEGCVWGRQ